MFRLPDGRLMPPDVAFSLGEGDTLIQYPANWLRNSTPEWRAANGVAWEEQAPEPPPPPPSKEQLLTAAAARRFEAEVAGCTWNGFEIHTDRDSQGKLSAQLLAISVGLRPNPSSWKFKNGFASLSNDAMTAVIGAVYAHVATVYAIEEQLAAAINDGSITSFDQINATNWPSGDA